MSITQIDESNLVNDVNRGKEDAEDIVEKLHELDKSQVDAMESVKEDLHTMKNYVTELETMFKDGDLSVGDYSVKAVSGLESFRDILESIYNERDIYAIILGKLQRGGILTNVEKAELYDYFQSIIDDETRKEIEEIASLINEKDIDKLKERLNEEVILSIDALEEEIAMVQAYIYIWGDKTPNDLDIERENKQKLEAYLILLQSYYFALGKWGDPVAQINQLKYKENPQGLSGHYLQSDIQTDEYRPNIKDKMNKDEFRELIFSSDNHFDPDGSIVVNLDKIEITYFSKANASNLSDFLETEGLLKKNANYTRDFIIDQSLSKIFSLLGNQISNTKLVYDYLAGKQNLEKQITIEEAKNTAAFLGMEFSISNNHTTNGDGYGIEVKLYPTETTFKALERWEEVHNDDPSIPYPPEDAIKTQDWHKISKFLYKYNTSIDDDVFDFITYGT